MAFCNWLDKFLPPTRGEREGGIEWERKDQRKWYRWEREREESSVRERWVEREKLEKLNKMWKVGIKYNYFGLCYKTILHLDGTVVQLQILLQFQDFARPDDELFLCLYTKIYQHMTYRRPQWESSYNANWNGKNYYIYIYIYIYILGWNLSWQYL